MKRINILSQNVYNRIAAGEVVDRPYSAVKELIENSLDAGATEIEIRIENGGKQLIQVADDGSGILKEDLPAAFLPHATSKISEVEDLNNIGTLGFRGEALASISAVSKVEIISATKENPAYKITCEGGVTGNPELAALEHGTVIKVKNLFYNTPVRARFLKPDNKEEADITSFVSRYILCYPNIRFRYYADDKLVLQSYGGGLEEAMAQVYGAKTLSQCIKINAEHDGIKIYGFIGNQNFFKPNKSYQSLFLNGRYIVNNTIATAISNAYASYAMKRQFPFYVLNVDVPCDIVDVNVHPNKADVRFVDPRFIFGVVYKVISSILDGTATAAEFVVRIPEIKSTSGDGENKNAVYSENKADRSLIEKYLPDRTGSTEGATNEVRKQVEKPHDPESEYIRPQVDMPLHEYYEAEEQLKKYRVSTGLDIDRRVSDSSLENSFPQTAEEIKKEYFERRQERLKFENVTYCGSIFNTYLLYENGDDVYIIDQHAAHERLIYDRLTAEIQDSEVMRQPLLYPYIFEVNAEETPFINRNIKILDELGFTVSEFGTCTYRVDEIPAHLHDINIKSFFNEVLADIDSYKDIKLKEVFKDKLATTACKHAVKGGMKLSEQEVAALFRTMDGDMGLKCPHGRPVCVKLTKRDFEKMFKRIV